MNKIVVIVAGNSGVGKDYLIGKFREIEPRCNRFSITDFAIPIAREMGWDGERGEKGRKLLADIIDLALWYSDVPLKKLVEKCAKDNSKFTFVILKDPRDIILYKWLHSIHHPEIKLASCVVYKSALAGGFKKESMPLAIDNINYSNNFKDLFDFSIFSSESSFLREKLIELMEANNG